MKDKNKENAAIGTFIRNHLAHSGMQQTELAKKLGIHPSTLNQMISGVAPLPLHRFYQIATILNFTQEEIEKVNELYRNRLMITPEQSRQLFVSSDQLKEQIEANNGKGNESFSDDYILNRIITIYAESELAERAELLAAAERVAAKSGTPQPKTPVIEPVNKTESDDVLNCPKCGKEIPVPEGSETLFCVHCGQKIRIKD